MLLQAQHIVLKSLYGLKFFDRILDNEYFID